MENFHDNFIILILKGNPLSDDDSESVSREASPCSESPRPVSVGSESPNENICTMPNQMNSNNNNNNNNISSCTNISNKITNTVGTNSSSNIVSKFSSGMQHHGNGRMVRMDQKVGVSIQNLSIYLYMYFSPSFLLCCFNTACYF